MAALVSRRSQFGFAKLAKSSNRLVNVPECDDAGFSKVKLADDVPDPDKVDSEW